MSELTFPVRAEEALAIIKGAAAADTFPQLATDGRTLVGLSISAEYRENLLTLSSPYLSTDVLWEIACNAIHAAFGGVRWDADIDEIFAP